MRLSKQTSDAIKILVLCAGSEDGLIKVADLARQLDLTKPLGLKLVNLLARLGYVETVRGRNGGLRLSRDPKALTVGAVVRDLEGFSITGATAQDGGAAFGSFVDDAFEAFLMVLDRHTIADMARTSVTAAPETSNAADTPRQIATKPKAARPAKGDGSTIGDAR